MQGECLLRRMMGWYDETSFNPILLSFLRNRLYRIYFLSQPLSVVADTLLAKLLHLTFWKPF